MTCLLPYAWLPTRPSLFVRQLNQQMYRNIATQENIATLKRHGFHIWGPDSGEQACGDIGPGRMLDPMELVRRSEAFFRPADLAGIKIAITAGPTREAIDPVRYLTNHSSGKMGFAIAEAAARRGAQVTLISGPVNLATPAGVERNSTSPAPSRCTRPPWTRQPATISSSPAPPWPISARRKWPEKK